MPQHGFGTMLGNLKGYVALIFMGFVGTAALHRAAVNFERVVAGLLRVPSGHRNRRLELGVCSSVFVNVGRVLARVSFRNQTATAGWLHQSNGAYMQLRYTF